jgi:hypothetical protein
MAMRAASSRILAVQLNQRPLDRKRRANRTLGIILLSRRIAEHRHLAVTELLGNLAAHLLHRPRSGVEIGTH